MGKRNKIWRIENQNGLGPYRKAKQGGLLNELEELGFNDWDDPSRPPPRADKGLQKSFFKASNKPKRLKWLFGFSSLRQLNAWFNTKEVRDLLDQNGFFLTCYQVDKDTHFHGDKQSIFVPKGSVIKEFRDISGSPINARTKSELPKKMKKLLTKRSITYSP